MAKRKLDPPNQVVKTSTSSGATGRELPQANEPGSAGRTPKATNVEQFLDSAYASRDSGQWPMLLQRAWGLHQEDTEPLPLAQDNWENEGSRASQYNA